MKHKNTKLATAIAALLGAQAQSEEIRQVLPEIIVTGVRKSAFVGVAFATSAGGVAQSAHARAESNQRSFRIPADPLSAALSQFATAAGARLSFDPGLTEGKTTRGLIGDFTPEEGLAALLAGTGLEWAPGPGDTYTVRPTARAQATPEAPVSTGEQPVELDPIIVTAQPLEQGFKANMQETATKTPLSIRETPQSISVITQDSLKARQVIDIRQALETSAGVTLFSGTGPFAGNEVIGRGNFQIRGFANGGNDFREDGFISPIFGGEPDLAPYERIEVVKGPSSTLYGRSNAGGFLNRVRKKPLLEFHAEIAPSVGSFDFYRLNGDVTGPLFESDKVRGRLVLAYEDAGSFVDSVESDSVVAAPSLELDLTDRTELLLQSTYQRNEFLPNNGMPLVRDGDIFRAPNIPRSRFLGLQGEDESTAEVVAVTAQLEQQLGDRWLATLRVNNSTVKRRATLDGYAYSFREDGDDPTTPEIERRGDTTIFSAGTELDTDIWSGELRLQGDLELFGRPVTVALGADHSDTEYLRSLSYAYTTSATPDISANVYANNFDDFGPLAMNEFFNPKNNDKETGVYGQLHFRPFDRLGVLLGGRHDWVKQTNLDLLTDAKDEQDDKAFTGRAGLTFDLTKQMSVYGLYAQSFSPVGSTGEDGKILDPETGEIFEAGIKSEWFDGKLGVNAAIFRLDRNDIPIPVETPPGTPGFSISGGLQRADGFELEINGEPLPGWSLSFAGSLLDPEFKEGPFVGSIPIGAADWQVGLYTSYELQSGLLKGLGLGAGLFAIDERGASFFADEGAKLEGYERVDLYAFYKGFKPFDIRLQVRNALDETYVETSDRTGAFTQFGSPTAVLLTVRYDFDY